MMTATIQEIRKVLKETRHLLDRLDRSKVINNPTGAGTATSTVTPDLVKLDRHRSVPWTKEDVRTAMGFDPNDESAKVEFKTFNGEQVATATVTPKPEPVNSTGGEQEDTVAFTPPWKVDIDAVLHEVGDEVTRASEKHPPLNSAHEGYAVLKEEVDELWDLIKRDEGYSFAARKEVIQVAAMALRYVFDLDPRD